MRGRVSFNLSSILWSIPFLFEFKLFGSDFFPDLLGIALLCHGLSLLKKKNVHFGKALLVANITLGWVIFKYLLSVAWLLKRESMISNELWIAPIIDIITLILLALVLFEGGKALIKLDQVPTELANKLIGFGKAYGVYTLAAIAIRGVNLFYGSYFGSSQWVLFAISVYFIVRSIILVRQVYKVYEPERFVDSVQVVQPARTRFLSPNAPGVIGLILAIISNLPFGAYLLFFWYTDSLIDKTDPTAGSGIGYVFAYLFVFGAVISVSMGILSIIVTYFSRAKSTLYRSALITAIFGVAQPFLIMLMVTGPGRYFIWPGI
ncbi:hypothetical protein D3C77_236380 [compost metagenome]